MVDVDDPVLRPTQTEISAGGAVVLETNREVAGQFAVDVERILLDVGRLLVLIDELDVAADPFERTQGVAAGLDDATRERVGQRGRWEELSLVHERVLAVANLAVIRRADELVVPRGLIDAVAAANHCAGIHGVHDAHARRELGGRLIALLGRRSVDSGIDETTARARGAKRAAGIERAIERHGEPVLLLPQPVLVLDAEAGVEREPRADAEVVLDVRAVVTREVICWRRYQDAAQVARVTSGKAEQHAGEVVARRIRTVDSIHVRIRRRVAAVEVERAGAVLKRLRVDADGAVVDAHLHGVATDQSRNRPVGAPRVKVAVRRINARPCRNSRRKPRSGTSSSGSRC